MIKRQMYGRAGFTLLPHPPQLRLRTVTTGSATEPLFLQSWSGPPDLAVRRGGWSCPGDADFAVIEFGAPARNLPGP
jgi:hypothetical protein